MCLLAGLVLGLRLELCRPSVKVRASATVVGLVLGLRGAGLVARAMVHTIW